MIALKTINGKYVVKVNRIYYFFTSMKKALKFITKNGDENAMKNLAVNVKND